MGGYRKELYAHPVCPGCGRPITNRGLLKALVRGNNFSRGPKVGRERSSISRANAVCYSCGRDSAIVYLWVDRYKSTVQEGNPAVGYQLMPRDVPEAVMARIIERRERNPDSLNPASPREKAEPLTAQQAELGRAWITRIRKENEL